MVLFALRPLLLNTEIYTFKYVPFSYRSCKNAPFDESIKSTRAISKILKTEGLDIFEVRDLADARTTFPI